MNLHDFYKSLEQAHPPARISPGLLALWYDAKGNWHMSHAIAQDIGSPEGDLIHAYLHRKEGDLWNADYWYRQAGKKRPEESLEKEFEILLQRYITE